MRQTDEALIARAGRGEIAVLEELFLRHAEAILNVVFPIVGRKGLAEDVVHDTFLLLLEKPPFTKGGNAKAWLSKIAVNLALQELRRERKRSEALPDRFQEETCDEERHETLLLLQQLPYDQRVAVVLKKVEDFSYEECAEILGVPPGTVQSRVFYGMQRLREMMDRNGVAHG